ncbi:AMP-binding protein [Winogradskyella ursingii]|uniref:AMP-binding protein n=1 Tax=Winogradskyella ursingii TaxID=2686079 RepID=UPI0015CA20E4|nr:AMP-binding protein [Winogradskyella ursingii]
MNLARDNSTLYNLIAASENVNFIDASNDTRYTLEQIDLPINNIELARSLIFLYTDNSLNSLVTYLNLLKTKHVLVLLSNTIETKLKENLENDYEPSIIFDDERSYIDKYEARELSNENIEIKLHINKEFKSVLDDNLRLMLSTSGTTGSPKFVKLSEENIKQNAISISDYLPIESTDVTPLNLPLHYSYGLSVLHSNAINGATIVCGLPDILSKDFWKHLNEYEFTSIAGVPFIYEMFQRIGFLKKPHPSLKYITQAGGNLSQNIKSEFNNYCIENGIEFFVMYGQTEATARISFVPPSMLEDKITSIGKPIKNGNITIDIDTDELLYSGPNVFGGYAKQKEDLATWENIEMLRTGDLAKQDEDGYFYISGRLKRIAKVFGNRVNLDEIEAFVKSNLNLSLLACTGINDKFILIAHSHKNLEEAELKKAMFGTFKIQGSAIKFHYFDTLPKTKNEKIDYKTITSIYLEK